MKKKVQKIFSKASSLQRSWSKVPDGIFQGINRGYYLSRWKVYYGMCSTFSKCCTLAECWDWNRAEGKKQAIRRKVSYFHVLLEVQFMYGNWHTFTPLCCLVNTNINLTKSLGGIQLILKWLSKTKPNRHLKEIDLLIYISELQK